MRIKTVLGALVGFGCGGLIVGVGLGGTGCSGTPEVDEFAVALATTYCEALEGCCKKASFEYDEASCKAQLTNDIQRSADVVKRGKVTYEKDAAEACIDAYKARGALCAEDAGTPSPEWIRASHRGLLHGLQGHSGARGRVYGARRMPGWLSEGDRRLPH